MFLEIIELSTRLIGHVSQFDSPRRIGYVSFALSSSCAMLCRLLMFLYLKVVEVSIRLTATDPYWKSWCVSSD